MDPVGFSLENFDAVGRWRDLEEGQPIDATGGLPDGSKFTGVAGLEQALLNRPELFVGTLTEKLLTFALGRGVEHFDAPAIRKIVRERRSTTTSLLVADRGNRQEHAVSDEEIPMIVTKKALPRRTFLRGAGAALALPLLDAMIPAMTALADTPPNPARLRRLGFVYMPMGCDVTRWTPPGETLDEFSPILSPLAPVRRTRDGDHEPGAAERLSRTRMRPPTPRSSVPPSEADREHGLLPGHDGRSDRRPADRPGDAAAVAGTVDGPAVDRRPVRQRLRLRLSEQPFVVVADDAAAGRGASADRLRESVRRRRQRGRTPRRARRSSQPARFGGR